MRPAPVRDRLLEELEQLRRSHRELTDWVEHGAVGLHRIGPDGAVLWANQTELDLLGYTRQEYLGRHIADFHVSRAAADEILSRLAAGETLRNYPVQLRHKRGEIRDVLISSSVYWENGEFVHTRCFTIDVTDRRRAERRLTLLAEAGTTLATSFDVDQMLQQVARMMVPALGDWCAIDVAAEDGSLQRTAVVHADPAKRSAAEQLQRRYREIPRGMSHTAARVNGEARAWVDPHVSPQRLAAEARDAEHLELLRTLGFGAELVVPLSARNHALGTVTLVSAAPGRYEDSSEVQLAEALARRCALGLDNARLYRTAESARQRTERLQAITTQLGARLDVGAVLRQVADAAADLLDSEFAGVYLLDSAQRPGAPGGTGDTFVLAAGRGLDQSQQAVRQLPRRGSLGGRAVETGETLAIADMRAAAVPAVLPLLAAGRPVGALLVAPILAPPVQPAGGPGMTGDSDRASRGTERVPLGVIEVYASQPRPWSPDDERLLAALAGATGVAVTNARLYQEAQESRARVEALAAEREQFLAAASHDLKNPLAAARGNAQILQRALARSGTVPPERLEPALANITASLDRMTRQINELLDVARARLGQPLGLERMPTDLVALARQSVRLHQATTERHRLIVETALTELVGQWDTPRLERVLGNLLSNAVKYSPAGGDVVLTIAREPGDWARLTVQDHGVGIPAADIHRIFERFQRGANVTGRIEGTGLGLPAARQVVEQHGGTIAVESTEGAGTRVTVRLPLAAPLPSTNSGDVTR